MNLSLSNSQKSSFSNPVYISLWKRYFCERLIDLAKYLFRWAIDRHFLVSLLCTLQTHQPRKIEDHRNWRRWVFFLSTDFLTADVALKLKINNSVLNLKFVHQKMRCLQNGNTSANCSIFFESCTCCVNKKTKEHQLQNKGLRGRTWLLKVIICTQL